MSTIEIGAYFIIIFMAVIGAWVIGSWLGDKTKLWIKRRQKK